MRKTILNCLALKVFFKKSWDIGQKKKIGKMNYLFYFYFVV